MSTLSELRRSKDMSLGECAKACGLKASELSHIEWGRKKPTNEIVNDLARVLGQTEDAIRESIPKEDPQVSERVADVFLALRKCSEDAKAKGLKKGHGGTGEVECPICKKRLRYSVASYNGHMWGSCETEGCVRWMQ